MTPNPTLDSDSDLTDFQKKKLGAKQDYYLIALMLVQKKRKTWQSFADSLEMFGCKGIAELVIQDFDNLGIKNKKDLEKFIASKERTK